MNCLQAPYYKLFALQSTVTQHNSCYLILKLCKLNHEKFNFGLYVALRFRISRSVYYDKNDIIITDI